MAKKPVVQVLVDGAAVESAAPVPPTLAAAAQASTDANNERLAGLVERAGGPAAVAADTTAKAKTPDEEYAEWVESLPADKRTKFEDSVRTTHAQGLAEFYGPEVSQVLADVARDPKLKKALSRMTDEKARQWILDTAFPIYDDERFGAPVGGDGKPAPNAQLEELTTTVKELKTKDAQREQNAALEALRLERVALENTFPELKWSDPGSKEYKRVEAIVEDTLDRRAKGKNVSMADVYTEMKDMWDWQAANPAPRPAPATSSAAITGPQAPRTKFESRAGMNAMLDKHGSIGQLAAALKR